MNASRKWFKAFLASRIRKLGSPVAPIFGTHVKFLDFLFLDKFTTIPLALSPSSPTTSLSSALNAFGADFDNPVVFNREVSSAAILLKS